MVGDLGVVVLNVDDVAALVDVVVGLLVVLVVLVVVVPDTVVDEAVLGIVVGPAVDVAGVCLLAVLLVTLARMMADRTRATMDITDTTISAVMVATFEDGIASV